MASTVVDRMAGTNPDTGAPFVTGTISGVSNGNVLVVFVVATSAGGAVWETTQTLTGCGQTWSNEATDTHTDGSTYTSRITCFVAHVTSFSDGALTAGGTGTAPTEVSFVGVYEVSEMPSSGAVIQKPTANDGASPGTALARSLNPFASANNVCLVAGSAGDNPQAIRPNFTWNGSLTTLPATEVDASGYFNAVSGAYLIGEDQDPDATLDESSNWAAIALELSNSPAAGGLTQAVRVTATNDIQ